MHHLSCTLMDSMILLQHKDKILHATCWTHIYRLRIDYLHWLNLSEVNTINGKETEAISNNSINS